MIDDFRKLEAALQDCHEVFLEIYGIISGPILTKKKELCLKKFTTLAHFVNKIESYVPTVDPITLKNEWGGDEFQQAWYFYKDYLKEQHGFVMASRMELKRLKFIRDACGNNVPLAIQYIDFLIATGSKSVININDAKLDSNIKTNHSDGKKILTLRQTANQ